MFSESLVNKEKKGWDWLDKAYQIDKRKDAIYDNRLDRLKSLKRQVPNLDFIYLDVWYAKGSWDSRKIAKEINGLGLILATEFPQDLEYNAVWNHWAVDYGYGSEKIKGFNSQIARFIRNHQKDTWIAKHPLLGGAEMMDFEGWQGRINYDKCIDITFEVNLPTKYLQNFPILNWKNNTIQFENNVAVSNVSGKRVITKDGIVVTHGDTYLLAWNPVKEEKLYHWAIVALMGLPYTRLMARTIARVSRSMLSSASLMDRECKNTSKTCSPWSQLMVSVSLTAIRSTSSAS